MSARKKPGNFVQRLHRKIRQFFNAVTKAFVNWILRSLLLLQRPSRLSQAGFVLPTVVMVVLVVVLLTTAIMIRSFDRSKNASNYRVNEVVLNAASPALDRARSKLNNLFSPDETALKGNTPDESDIAQVFENPKYTFGDETPLKLVYDLNEDNSIDLGTAEIPSAEQLKTAWKFPVDTDNNGKFDSFTLYGIYFRTSSDRARNPLEARARPQFTGTPDTCAAGNGGGGGGNGDNGWFPISGQLKKAFFTYVATVPITQLPTAPYKGNIPTTQFETYKGNKGFSALEMQQDQARLALDNNAVWYEDDLIITDVRNFKLNGRIQTNGNLMLGTGDGGITFYQVSSLGRVTIRRKTAKLLWAVMSQPMV
jgi:type II secretory pathway pseudopilin PulG